MPDTPYSVQTWTNGPTGGTPLSAARLTVMENGIRDSYVGRSVSLHNQGAGQTAPSGAVTNIDWRTTRWNDDTSLYTVTLASDTITVLESGLYFVSFNIAMAGGSTGYRLASCSVNGSIIMQNGTYATSPTLEYGSTAGPTRCVANDVLRVAVYVDGGTGVYINDTQVYDTTWQIIYMGS